MAKLLWGKVYYDEYFAGTLQEEPGERLSFSYDPFYLNANHPAIAYTLPKQEKPFISENELHPFFDNLVSEGWLEQAQMRLLGKRTASRFELLLAFGFDCSGAVSVIDPEPDALREQLLEQNNPKEVAVFKSRASLSGVQPKLAIIKRDEKFYPAKIGELSTHIAKFSSQNHPDLAINEYLTMTAFKILLPNDEIAEFEMGSIEGISEPAFIVKRFDRKEGKRIHFEEFNQLLGKKSKEKYHAGYEDLASFLMQTQNGPSTELYRLFNRILVGFLLGNTDMHLKNFAVFPQRGEYTLTPSYDQIASVLYDYKTIALQINHTKDLFLAKLKPIHLISLADKFGISKALLNMSLNQLQKKKSSATQAIAEVVFCSKKIKNKMIQMMEARWNGTFALIGPQLSKKL